MTFKGFVSRTELLVKSAINEEVEYYFSKEEMFEDEGEVEYDIIEVWGVELEINGHWMNFDNIVEN